MTKLFGDPLPLSVTRKGLMYYFSWPANPYVSFTVSIDFSHAQRYLEQLPDEAAVSVNHLVCGCIARVLSEFPIANGRIVGGRIFPQDDVSVMMPVNLIGHKSKQQGELAATLVEAANRKSLLEIAASNRRSVERERSGAPESAFVRGLMELIERTPYPLVHTALQGLERLTRRPDLAEIFYAQFPFTTVLSNVGAVLKDVRGGVFRGASMAPSGRLVHVGTVWGISALQDEVFAEDGEAVVRPALPLIVLFDHRLFDGVMAGRILERVVAILQDPAQVFGEDAARRIDEGL